MAGLMSKKTRVGIVGCGVFGAMIALRLSEAGCDVTVYERAKECLRGASFNNQNRLHLGFHYPRDILTARQCIQGFSRFHDEFPECIVSGFPNMYFISERDSYTGAETYEDFCNELDVNYSLISKQDLPVNVLNVTQATLCEEVVYDCNLLRTSIMERINSSGVTLITETQIDKVKKSKQGFELSSVQGTTDYFDHVINCTYADINRLTSQLGYAVDVMQYEYTMIPIIKTNIETVGITIMDGPFMTLLPFGQTSNFLMYHVDHSVIERSDSENIDKAWLDPETSPIKGIDLESSFQEMREACAYFVPELSDAEMIGVLQGPRVVMAKSDKTDTRPSIVRSYGQDYHTVFSGKIDHCVWVADELLELVRT